MDTPEGYRPLCNGEIIKSDDLVWMYDKWRKEHECGCDWTGRKYEEVTCLPTFRLIADTPRKKT